MHMSRQFRVALSTTLAALLAGCLIVPIGMFSENPYTKDKLAPLLNAGRGLVRQKFGNPAYTRENQRFWFYSNQRATVGVIAGTGSAVFTDDDWLLLEFNNDGRVIFAETRELKKCTSNGICFDGVDIYVDPIKGTIHSIQPKEEECAVYLYLDKLPWPLATGLVRYSVNGKPVGVVSSDSYLYLTNPQGNIEISAYDLKISTKCIGGDSLYVRAVKKADWSWKTGKDLAPVTLEEGLKRIKERHLGLPD